MTVWLLSLGTRAEWSPEVPGLPWLVLPVGLMAISLVMPAAILWLHDRYGLRAERDERTVYLTTFLIWGQRNRAMDVSAFRHAKSAMILDGEYGGDGSLVVRAPALRIHLASGDRRIFDSSGDAPLGWDALDALTEP